MSKYAGHETCAQMLDVLVVCKAYYAYYLPKLVTVVQLICYYRMVYIFITTRTKSSKCKYIFYYIVYVKIYILYMEEKKNKKMFNPENNIVCMHLFEWVFDNYQK